MTTVPDNYSHIRRFADKDGSKRALFHLNNKIHGIQPEDPRPTMPERLGQMLLYKPVMIDLNDIERQLKAQAKAAYPNGAGKPPAPEYKEIDPLIWEATQVAAKEQLGIEKLDRARVCGKDEIAWIQTENSVPMELDDQDWRRADMLRSEVTKLARTDPNRYTPVGKEELGDGVFLVATGESLGLDPWTMDFFQTRAMVRRPVEGVEPDLWPITRVFKGIIIVHPFAQNVIAWDDGYGQESKHSVMDIFSMVKGSKYNPRNRYNVQGLYYQGIREWWRYLFGYENVLRLADSNSSMVEERLIAANAPVRALGGTGLHTLFARLTSLSIPAGVGKKALPAKAFRYIRGLEYVAQIEDDASLFDNTNTFDTPGTYQQHLPRFFAPESEREFFTPGLDSSYALNRSPDMPTGQCVIRHKLVGFIPFNAIVTPSWSLRLAGNDYDGDDTKVFHPVERGGLYVCFNDRDLEEQEYRLRSATTNRAATKKENYPDGVARWAGDIEATQMLGIADITARKLIDRDQHTHAYRLQPWIQTAVDRKKRPIPWPDPRGTREMPVAHKEKHEEYLTDALRLIAKGDDVPDHLSPYYKAHMQFTAKMDKLRELSEMAEKGKIKNILSQNESMTALAVRWAMMIHSGMKEALTHLVYFDKREEHHTAIPVPHQVDYKARTLPTETIPMDSKYERVVNLLEWMNLTFDRMITSGWDKKLSSGAFNVKDAMVLFAEGHDLRAAFADRLTNYSLFRNFATTQQLASYFEQSGAKGPRIGDVFTHFSPFEAFQRTYIGIQNSMPVRIGLQTLAPGEIVITDVPADTHKRLLLIQGRAYVVSAFNFREAILQARAILNCDVEAPTPLSEAQLATCSASKHLDPEQIALLEELAAKAS